MNFKKNSGILVWIFPYSSSSTQKATVGGPAGGIYEIISSPVFSDGIYIFEILLIIGVVRSTRFSRYLDEKEDIFDR